MVARRTKTPFAIAAVLAITAAVGATGEACETQAMSDACEGSCPDPLECATVCPCEAGDCPMFACVTVGVGGKYMYPDGAYVASCSTP